MGLSRPPVIHTKPVTTRASPTSWTYRKVGVPFSQRSSAAYSRTMP
jgi:hypothetical protein